MTMSLTRRTYFAGGDGRERLDDDAERERSLDVHRARVGDVRGRWIDDEALMNLDDVGNAICGPSATRGDDLRL